MEYTSPFAEATPGYASRHVTPINGGEVQNSLRITYIYIYSRGQESCITWNTTSSLRMIYSIEGKKAVLHGI